METDNEETQGENLLEKFPRTVEFDDTDLAYVYVESLRMAGLGEFPELAIEIAKKSLKGFIEAKVEAFSE